jgi:ribosome-associated toxin RatA of RatAB toxin-antitoxin module
LRRLARPGAAVCVMIQAVIASASATDGPCGLGRDGLRAGRIEVVARRPSDDRGVALRACGRVDAPPGLVWNVLRDCDKFERFLPRVSRSRLASRADNVVVCDETIDLPFPLGDLHSVTRVVESARPGGGFERRWSLVHGTYRRLEGAWLVLPADESASKSLVVYEVDMEPDSPIPDFLMKRAQSAAALEVFRAVRERVRQCGAGPEAVCAEESGR